MAATKPTPIAIVAGVGPGTGSDVARRFAKSYPTLLLARKPASYDPVVSTIQSEGGNALGVPTDMTSSADIRAAIEAAAKWQNTDPASLTIAAAVFNVGGTMVRAPFLELTEEGFETTIRTAAMTGFLFAQAVLPGLLKYAAALEAAASGAPDAATSHSATLIFTGATASVKGSANFASFAAAKHALRAMSQSLAREFFPRGVHVAHVVMDGIIDTPATAKVEMAAKINPKAIAETYWNLHAQSPTAWTWESELRPWQEKW